MSLVTICDRDRVSTELQLARGETTELIITRKQESQFAIELVELDKSMLKTKLVNCVWPKEIARTNECK